MPSKRRLMVAGLTMALMAGLGACGSGQNDNPWEDSTASARAPFRFAVSPSGARASRFPAAAGQSIR